MLQNNFNCETIIFGKGVGESILMKLSNSEWMIVDSCLNDKKKPAALDYLYSVGVDPISDVKLIVISHFHNDHILGLSEIISICVNAKVVISHALNTKEFNSYLEGIIKSDPVESQVTELKKVMDSFSSLIEQHRLGRAQSDLSLYRSSAGVSVTALSPCDNDINESDVAFANLQKIDKNTSSTPKSASIINPNNYSVVLRINRAGFNDEILLGADLEVRNNGGWESVCECINKPGLNVSNIFKIPHHGSDNGYHERTWKEIISANPFCILTTYDSGKSPLPKIEMVNLYKSLSNNVFSTTTPKSSVPLKNEGIVKDTLKGLKSKVRFNGNNKKFGYIHISNGFTASPDLTLFGDAVKL